MNNKQYGVVLADPPWPYRNRGVNGAAEKHYPTMSIRQIQALPVGKLAMPNSVLLLWGTWPNLPLALSVLQAWGFQYVTGFPWIKVVNVPSVEQGLFRPFFGTGFWVRGCSEYVLIGRRGKVSPPTGNFVGLLSENFQHSRKPASIHEYAETMTGPYIELFARQHRPGWDVWGNEVASTVQMVGG